MWFEFQHFRQYMTIQTELAEWTIQFLNFRRYNYLVNKQYGHSFQDPIKHLIFFFLAKEPN